MFEDLIDQKISQLGKEIQDLKYVVGSKCAQMTNLKCEISGLKSELNHKINQIDINRDEATFEFELTNVTDFFADDNDRYSDIFYVKCMPFSMNIEFRKKDDSVNHMGLYLYCHNNDIVKVSSIPVIFTELISKLISLFFSFRTKWSCSTKFKLKLLSHLPGRPTKEKEFSHVFSRQTGFGNSKFITISELMDEKNGFVLDNKMTLVVQMVVDEVVRLK